MPQQDPITLLSNRLGSERFAAIAKLLDKSGTPGDALRLLSASEFFRYLVERQIDWIECEADFSGSNVDQILEAFEVRADVDQNEATLLKELRLLRQRVMLQVVWRSFTQPNGLDEAFELMSGLADFVIKTAVSFAEYSIAARFGVPIGEDSGVEQKLIVIAMGKLGGRELNLSSDIDIVFAYDEGGKTSGGRSTTSNQEFFTRVAQTAIRLIDSVTEDGRVFRVDTRLRPFGDSGALVASYQSLENYYQQHGRDWERYALLKSRCVTGLPDQIRPFQLLAQRFVFRRYTDFGVIEGLREMKSLINAERLSKGLADDVKRGPGGIREAEFIVQSQQLVRGGRIPSIQTVGFCESAEALSEAQCLDADTATTLVRHYRFLRQLEHAIQALRDQQTHALPTDPSAQKALCGLLHYQDWNDLLAAYDGSRRVIAGLFEQLLDESSERALLILGLDAESPKLDRLALNQLSLSSETVLAEVLERFIEETRFRVLDSEASQRLQKALPLVVKEADCCPDPGETLKRVLTVISAVLKRSAYLSLLIESTHARSRFVNLVSRSEPITLKLCERPDLLDELLFPASRFTAPSKDDIQALLDAEMEHIDLDDLEAAMQALRRLKEAVVFRVAASELEGSLSLMKVSDNLSFLAEVILERATALSYRHLVQKYGQPGDGAEFCVLAYGKLGGIELSYESDLDLVFVCNGDGATTNGPKPIENRRFFTRLAQRIIHILSTNMMGGRLYEIDLRLRPNGDSGLLVTSLSALNKYLASEAWTWEHQALVRARVVSGGSVIARAVEALRIEILCTERVPEQLASDVTSMRTRMREHRHKGGTPSLRAQLKYARGGIVDIEFVVQYLVLLRAARHPEICRWSDVVRIVDELKCFGILGADSAVCLRDAYLTLRSSMHRVAMSYETEQDLTSAMASMERAQTVCIDVLPNL